MERILFTWIGATDLNASKGILDVGVGPVLSAVESIPFQHVVILSNYPEVEEENYIKWLKKKTDAKIYKYHFDLSSPTNFAEIYEAVIFAINDIKRKLSNKDLHFTYHLSPGTPAMAAVWVLIGKTIHQAELIESSKEMGVRKVDIPFDISLEYIPKKQLNHDEIFMRLTLGLPPQSPEFDNIIHKCKEMKLIIAQARRLAMFDVPILIQGESGTGKELFARAIHSSSQRKDKPFIAVNCGAIPQELIESELFGYKKGAFTGAVKDKDGYFAAANEGTLFLDEIGELPLYAQVKLLRVLQEQKVAKIGDTKAQSINVRIIAATNRNLLHEVSQGRFREDLFHRIAIGYLYLPPLRNRPGDINLLIDHFIQDINNNFKNLPNWKDKKISISARNFINQQKWYGNVRELYNTLLRAAILISDETIEIEHIKASLLSLEHREEETILNRPIGDGFSLKEVISEVAKHYLDGAIKESKGNKTKTAKLLGFSNYQTVSNWLRKYGFNE